MNSRHALAILLLGSIALLAACDRQDDRTSARKPGEPASALGNIVKNATDAARRKLETSNLSISDAMQIQVNGRTIRRPGGKTKAEITPQGDLLIEGSTVAVTPGQRRLLLQYRQDIIRIAGAGMDIGVQGADLGMKAASEAINGIFNGNADKVEERIKPEADKIEAAATKLCNLLAPMLATQTRLAASLPEFRPYATMTQDDISDCRTERGKRDGETRARTGQEIRQQIQDSIRSAVGRDDEVSAKAAATDTQDSAATR